MSRSKRLEPVAGVAARREQHAAQTLKESRETLAQYEAQLRGLQSYRQEYVGGFQQAGSQGMQAGQMKDYLVFMDKLDAAISQLQAVISTSIERCERDKGVWLAKRAKLKALDKAIARYLKEEQQEEVRREQRDTDERAQQGAIKRGDG